MAKKLNKEIMDAVKRMGRENSLWGYMADPLIFVVNKQVWANWSEADRQAVREAAEQAAAENIVAARKGISPGDDALLHSIEKNGGDHHPPQRRPYHAGAGHRHARRRDHRLAPRRQPALGA